MEFAVPMLVQSSVLIVILLLADLALRKKVKAVFRYCIWMLILVKLILPTSLSSPLSLGYWFGDHLAYVAESRTAAAPEAEALEPALADMLHIIEPVPIEEGRPTPAMLPMMPGVEPAEAEPVSPPAVSVTPVTWQGVVFLVWLAVVIALGLLLLQRAMFVRGLVAQAREANALMNGALKYCRKCMGVKRKIGLKVSANATSPAVCGLFRPVILLPHKLAPSLGSSHLRAVLLHELAHIRRGDLWVNLVQTVLQIGYFYNPLLWLANAMIRRVREQAIDETVLVAMGEKAQQYPQTLVNVAKLAFKRPVLSLRLIGVVESKSALAGRIKHILNRPMPKTAKLGILGLIAVIVVGCVLLPMARKEPHIPPTSTIDASGRIVDKIDYAFVNDPAVIGTWKSVDFVQAIEDFESGVKHWPGDLYLKQMFIFEDGRTGGPWTWTKGLIIHPGDKTAAKYHIKEIDGSTYMFFEWKSGDYTIRHMKPRYYVLKKVEKRISPETTEPAMKPTDAKYVATLSNGVTVELVGVCEHPSEGKQWWQPDGSLLQEKPYGTIKGDRVFFGTNERAYEFVVRLAGPTDVDIKWEKMPDSVGSYMTSFPHGSDGRLLPGLRVLITKFHKRTGRTLVRIGVAPKVPDKDVVQDYEWVEFKNVSLRPGDKTRVRVEGERQSSRSNLIEKLQAAIVGGDISKVEKLIGEGVSVNMPGKEGRAPLRWAVDGGHKEIVELLIRNDSNVSIPDDYGATPLHITGTKPKADTAKYLDIAGILIANGADVNAKARSNRTPLHFCAKYGNKDFSELLVASGASIDLKDDFGKTPLLYAAGVHKNVSELLIENGADVTAKDKYGQTPLHLAANWGHVDVVKLFLDQGVDINAKDNNGLTPLDYATKKKYWDVMKLLAANGGYSAYKLENFELKRVFLSDVDDQAVMLDLASGQLVDIPEPVTGLEVLAAIDKLDKGDITYDARNLIFVRGATSNKSDVQAGPGSVKVYKIIDGWHLPERMIVTTQSGEQYELSIIGANKKGCRINYYHLVKADVQVEDPVMAALGWLKLVDDGDYGKSFDEMAELYRGAVSKADWGKTMNLYGKGFGKAVSRKVQSKRHTRHLPAGPTGEYVIIEFESSFEHKSKAAETVTLMRDRDGVWRVTRYFIK